MPISRRAPRLAEELVERILDEDDPTTGDPAASGLPLTPRQAEVLRLLAEGAAPPQIAAALAVSLHTVRNHIQAISRRLGVHSRVEMMAKAYRAGLV